MDKISDIFGSMVFNDAVMRERLPKETYRQVQATMQRGFKNLLGHAAAAIRAIRGQFVSLGTGTYRKAVLPPNLHKSLAQREPVGTGDTLHLRKIAPHFLV